MPRTLPVTHGLDTVDVALEKIERAKVYGTTETDVIDEDGQVCELATLADDGRTVIPRGGLAYGYLTRDGEWIERDDMTAVGPGGEPLEAVPSSFQRGLQLDQPATAEDVLSMSVRLVYRLLPQAPWPEALQAALADGAIYCETFSYRGGVTADVAYVLQGTTGDVFLLVGDPLTLSYVGFDQTAPLVEEAADGDDFDFGDL